MAVKVLTTEEHWSDFRQGYNISLFFRTTSNVKWCPLKILFTGNQGIFSLKLNLCESDSSKSPTSSSKLKNAWSSPPTLPIYKFIITLILTFVPCVPSLCVQRTNKSSLDWRFYYTVLYLPLLHDSTPTSHFLWALTRCLLSYIYVNMQYMPGRRCENMSTQIVYTATWEKFLELINRKGAVYNTTKCI